jgi:hypothetical protein
MDNRKTYLVVRKALENRIRAAFGLESKDLPLMSIVEMVDLFYCLWGQTNSLGNYSGAINSLRVLIGDQLMWEKPKPEQEPVGMVQ